MIVSVVDQLRNETWQYVSTVSWIMCFSIQFSTFSDFILFELGSRCRPIFLVTTLLFFDWFAVCLQMFS